MTWKWILVFIPSLFCLGCAPEITIGTLPNSYQLVVTLKKVATDDNIRRQKNGDTVYVFSIPLEDKTWTGQKWSGKAKVQLDQINTTTSLRMSMPGPATSSQKEYYLEFWDRDLDGNLDHGKCFEPPKGTNCRDFPEFLHGTTTGQPQQRWTAHFQSAVLAVMNSVNSKGRLKP